MHPTDSAEAFIIPLILNLGAGIFTHQQFKGNFGGCLSLFQEPILIKYCLLFKMEKVVTSLSIHIPAMKSCHALFNGTVFPSMV
jgi:hypothetical protein